MFNVEMGSIERVILCRQLVNTVALISSSVIRSTGCNSFKVLFYLLGICIDSDLLYSPDPGNALSYLCRHGVGTGPRGRTKLSFTSARPREISHTALMMVFPFGSSICRTIPNFTFAGHRSARPCFRKEHIR